MLFKNQSLRSIQYVVEHRGMWSNIGFKKNRKYEIVTS